MVASLTWLDLTARDREQMRRVLDLFGEQGTIDEMGLGTLRDTLSDALFPGTSSIQTRLRYLLFIPWIYQRLEKRPRQIGDLDRDARQAEIELISALMKSEDAEGVIGARARAGLTRLPSHVYWAGLVRWGIFRLPQSQSWYHTHFAGLVQGGDEVGRTDDPGILWSRQPAWHPRLPAPPNGFPWEASFALTAEEADFLRGRFAERCADSLLAWLAGEGSGTPVENFWDDPVTLGANAEIVRTIELARRFSLHVEGLPLLYNLLLAQRRHAQQGSDAERIDQYRAEIAEWAEREKQESDFDPDQLWGFMLRQGARLMHPQIRFVEHWSARVAEIGTNSIADDPDLHRLVAQRELQLKGKRARLANQGRLLDWSGRVGVGRMDFRWFRVRQLLIDLHRGLET